MVRFNCISLFSGAMGMDLGIEEAGFDIRLALENDKIACKTIKENRSTLKLIEEDIRNVPSEKILTVAGLKNENVDLIVAGPPCQSFSTAGKRGSLNDPRGSLFEELIRILKDIAPKYFIVENVKGIISSALKHRPINLRGKDNPPLTGEEKPGSVLEYILDEFKRIGYTVNYHILNSADYGVPQTRNRVFFIGSRNGKKAPKPEPTHSKDGTVLPKWKTFGDVMKTLAGNENEFLKTNGNVLKYMRQIKPGNNWKSLAPELQKEALGNAIKSGGGKTGYFRRLSFDKPSPTLTTSPAQKATLLFHPTRDRVLTVGEYAAIQQFPPDWKFVGSVQEKYKQIGNAVPVGLAEAVGKVVYKMLCDQN